MTEKNKNSLIEFAKVLVVALLGFIALITNVEIWNLASLNQTDGFHVVVSILNLAAEVAALYFFGTKVLFKKTEVKQ